MSDLHKDSVADNRGTGGGAATSAGITFQQQLGALFGVHLLAGTRFEEHLGLGSASPVWLRFETEAPIDDLLISTSNDGYLAIQAKTTISLSRNPQSPFGKVISQFVRHWLACRDGDGSLEWNRPLDPVHDRLVLAVGAHSSESVRAHLPNALRHRSLRDRSALTQRQQAALDSFDSCVTQAWESLTTEEFDTRLFDQLAPLVTVLTFDSTGPARTWLQQTLATLLADGFDAGPALEALETISGQMMTRREGADLTTLRQALMTKGVRLQVAPRYKVDIASLKDHSKSVSAMLRRHEEIDVRGSNPAAITRECQDVVKEAALESSLLIIGEPGAGKSGVLNSLARSLMDQDRDVLELAVDQHSVESLEGLSKDLKLEHGLVDVLEAWDGAGPAWLIIDALDATRGGKGESVFRTLIAQVRERCKRWRVVASIRTFDLRMGQQFRSLFHGTPPDAKLAEASFPTVRHIRIPPWSEPELQKLLSQAPTLSVAFAGAPPRLRELARTPFNTHLLSELIASGADIKNLRRISSQVELLRLYWSHRIESYGTPGERCLYDVVDAMVEARALRVRKHALVSSDPGMIDTLAHEGVLISVDDGRCVQFRHHILFDFTSAQVFLDRDTIVGGTRRFPKDQALGLMLAPALAFVLQEVWDSEADRGLFWTAVTNILADKDSDPVIRSAAARIGAEYPVVAGDTLTMAQRIAAGDERAAHSLAILSGALGVLTEDYSEAPLEPWIKLLGTVASNIGGVSAPARFLLLKFVERTQDDILRVDLGRAARALLEHGYSLENATTIIVPAAIGFVAETYDTDGKESRRLLSKVFDEDRFSQFASEEVPSVCHKIEAIAAVDPAFATEIYRQTYSRDVTEDRPTNMSSSQILPLTSNTRQDYDMARYALSEFVPVFLDKHPPQAIAAIIESTDGYVARQHPIPGDFRDHRLNIAGKNVRLREDYSHVWAHDPESQYSQDAELLIAALLRHLRSSKETVALYVANLVIEKASLAVFWSRLFMVSAERDDKMVDLVLPFAMAEQFLVMPDTRKDAIDVVAKGYRRLSSGDRRRFEQESFAFDFSDFVQPQNAKEHFLRTLFTMVGSDALATREARKLATEDRKSGGAQNERPFVLQVSRGSAGLYDSMREIDRELPANVELMAAIDAAKKVLALEPNASAPPGLTQSVAHESLFEVERTLNASGTTAQLRIYGEGVLGQGCNRVIEQHLLPDQADDAATGEFLRLLRLVMGSSSPEVDDSTEQSFETSASWGSPAARVEGAQAVFNLIVQRPALLPKVSHEITKLLIDPHPAVRMQAALHLVRTWDLDRDFFWEHLKDRLNQEQNSKVLEHVVTGVLGRVLHAAPETTESVILGLLNRFPEDNERRRRLRKVIASMLAILWVAHERDAARTVVETWIADSAIYYDELTHILSALRGAFVVGLIGDRRPAEDIQRHRALGLLAAIVDNARQRLATYHSAATPINAEALNARELARLLDTACRELYFASGARNDGQGSNTPASGDELETFFVETAPILERISDYATPHTVYNLLKLLEFLLPLDPERAFDLAAHALKSGGSRTGFHFEPMGADLIVRLIGIFLADHKEIFETMDRRADLIDCLEIFMDAGWSAAQRLLYRLPELIQ